MKTSQPCAIYTRKSSEEGLEQDFNSLHAQREACEAFILSQKQEGWRLVHDRYDDGGFSGGNMNRPALQRLMGDIAVDRIRIVVVYKVDRLTRSLADFAKLVEAFDAKGVSFVSVTQQFNTTSSMGRLTLNVLLSFAQFEREVTGERIRDKIAASKKKGMWMGGLPPVGYVAKDRTLVIDPVQAERLREIFSLYLQLGCVRKLKTELDRRDWITPLRNIKRENAGGGRPFSRGHLYRLLSNPIYLGKITHKEQTYPGNHPAIIDQELWGKVQSLLAKNRQGRRLRRSATAPSLLAGLVFDGEDRRLTPTHACKGSRRYRYYVSQGLVGKSRTDCSAGLRIPATELEDAVRHHVSRYLRDSSRLVADAGLSEVSACQSLMAKSREVAKQLDQGAHEGLLDLLMNLIDRIVVRLEGLEIRLKAKALGVTADARPLMIRVPMQLKRCGFGVRLILNAPGARRPEVIDQRLVRLVDRGIGWFNRMTSKPPQGVGMIAKADGVDASFVTRLAYLAFLAPDIVEAIRHGSHPATLTVDRLTQSVPLPMDWAEQRRLLGFAPIHA